MTIELTAPADVDVAVSYEDDPLPIHYIVTIANEHDDASVLNCDCNLLHALRTLQHEWKLAIRMVRVVEG
jgi:hypothetical protein